MVSQDQTEAQMVKGAFGRECRREEKSGKIFMGGVKGIELWFPSRRDERCAKYGGTVKNKDV